MINEEYDVNKVKVEMVCDYLWTFLEYSKKIGMRVVMDEKEDGKG